MKLIDNLFGPVKKRTTRIHSRLQSFIPGGICFGRSPATVHEGTLVLFPCQPCTFACGLAGIVAFGQKTAQSGISDVTPLFRLHETIEAAGLETCHSKGLPLADHYLAGDESLTALLKAVRQLKRETLFVDIFRSSQLQARIQTLADKISRTIDTQQEALGYHRGRLTPPEAEILDCRLETLLDIRWCLQMELMANILKTQHLIHRYDDTLSPLTINIFRQMNAVLNSIDRLEVRGRDSAGISLMFVFHKADFEKFRETLYHAALLNQLKERTQHSILLNNGISIHDTVNAQNELFVTRSLTSKVAAEIGSLGDNVRFLRNQIKNDQLLQILATFPHIHYSVTSHTRWASVGAISEANCHPADNNTSAPRTSSSGLIHVCLNGDIDNYLELRQAFENRWAPIPEDISTDTKIIPLQIESYLKNGHDIKEAFLMAVNDFEGSHAISMHTDLAPGKIFLAQRGSGQSIYIGIAEDHYMPVSEVYGFVEETQRYIKMDGETVI